MTVEKWYFRDDVDLNFCEVYLRKPGGGVTADDMHDTEAQALRAALRSMRERKKELKQKIDELKVRLKGSAK